MLLTNLSKRLITINAPLVNGQRQTSYRVKCGIDNKCEVPDELCDNAFVNGLIKSGDVIATPTAKVESPSEFDGMSESDLKAYAEALEIEVKSSWVKDDIIEAIEAVQ